MSATDTPDSGTLPGRLEWVEEPSYFGVPTDPEWQRFSDVYREYSADPGMSYEAQTATGTSDAQNQFRTGGEDPALEVTYDLQRALVDASGNAQDPAAYGMLRDSENQLPGSLLVVRRKEKPGGNDNAGVREYDVIRGARVESVNPDLDASSALPIQMPVSFAPRKVRSYLIHQPSAGTTIDVESTSANDAMDVTIESEGATTTDTVTLPGTADTAVTSTETFSDIDAIWVDGNPEGDITVTDGSGTTLMTIYGGLTYSADDQPVDGDRGVPALGAGSHASAIGSSYEHFVGDRLERPAGTDVRPVVTAGSWNVENDFSTDSPHSSRHPLEWPGNRTAEVETTVTGPDVGHINIVESLTKDEQDFEHELSNTLVTFKNTVPADVDPKEESAGDGRTDYSVTWAASGEPPIVVTQP